jgi:two-component system KDP operon response regulator KdpE
LSELATALIVDDDKQIRRLLRIILEEENYKVLESNGGRQALSDIALRKPDLVVLDLGLPDLPGLAVLQRLREWSQVPVLILSIRDGPEDKIAALDAGADDYVTKPFEAGELVARLRAIQRRARSGADEPYFRAGSLAIDFMERTVTINGQNVKLTATEYALLKILAQHAGKVITHKQLLREVWGPNSEDHSQYLRVYMNHLRKKLEAINSRDKLLRTESGIGYRLVLPRSEHLP